MSYPDNPGESLLVTMSPSEIRKEIASALENRRPAAIEVMDLNGTRSIEFRIKSTNHTPEDHSLDLIIGITEGHKSVQVTIPTNGESMLALRPLPIQE